jgi:hypothetical protein
MVFKCKSRQEIVDIIIFSLLCRWDERFILRLTQQKESFTERKLPTKNYELLIIVLLLR